MPVSARAYGLFALLGVIYVAGLVLFVGNAVSADAQALWLAGQFFDPANPGSIYRLSDGPFTMQPPDAWINAALPSGQQGPVYPFIYPPIWGWLMSQVGGVLSFDTFLNLVTALNRVLIPCMFILAWRIVKPRMALLPYLCFALIVTFGLTAFTVALDENQPQIWVSFLILLAIERQRAGHPLAAGCALALAAALKLYPALFALIWLAAGERRAVVWFALIGGALGAASVVLLGWPMHAAFLTELSAIASGAILTLNNFSLSPLIAAISVAPDALTRVSTEVTGGSSAWFVAQKTQTWLMGERVAQVMALAALLIAAHRTKMRDPLLWAGAAFVIAWLSPLSWTYHYMTALVFLPVVADRFGGRGFLLALIALAATSLPFFLLGLPQLVGPVTTVVLANAGLLVIGLGAFAMTMAKPISRAPYAASATH